MNTETNSENQLALMGGPKIREIPFPTRGHIGAEEKAAVEALFDAAIVTGNAPGYNGAAEMAYCEAFAESLGGGFVDAVSSGTAALYVALRALNLQPFTEVIVGAVTDPGGMMPIPLLNLVPMVADTAPDSYNTGPEQVEALVSPRTSAIVVPHIAGEPADIAGIVDIAQRHNIPVIEDCAQTHGARLHGRMVGTFGDIGVFSTMFGKHHSTGGQGGLVYTRDEALYQAIRRASDRGKPFFLPEGSTNIIASLNFNLNDLAAAIGSVQLGKLSGSVQRRRYIVTRLACGIKALKTVCIPAPLPGSEPSYWFLRMRFHAENATCDKATFCRALAAEGLPSGADYRAALPHTMEWFVKRRVFGDSGYPWASPDYTP
ncbi:MAG: DegT/DnrJ/EryC1/StrS family aminotransferase [Anaerolineae bacterium]|nr:DegT/DnrJ/EryC1/StrS family aminotransferase [Anaerolineae bacterium]